MQRGAIVNHYIPKNNVDATDGDEQTPHDLMKKGLMAASRQPARPSEVRSFKNLHSPRVHRMTEWILQYDSVCRRQEQYLQQIKDLRHQFQNYDSNKNLSRYGNVRRTSNRTGCFWGPSPVPSTKPNDTISNAACIIYPPKPRKTNAVSKEFKQASDAFKMDATDFLMAAKSCPTNHLRQSAELPQPLGIDRNKTDYEPIEHIARRNKLNFSKYFRDGQTWTRDASKETATTSDVYVR